MTAEEREAAVDRLAGEIVARMTVPLEASGRHVHLCREDVEALFGRGYQLTPVRPLSQPGQYVCKERVTLAGPKGELKNVVVLGPERKESQVEISLTDGVALGIKAPVRLSGEIEGTPGIQLRHGENQIRLSRGLIAAKRHIHLSPEEARSFGVENGQKVCLRTFTARPVIFADVEVRVSDKFVAAVHLDYDEANACGFEQGDRGLILTPEGESGLGLPGKRAM